ncbi:MAG: GAF domain-containing protein [Anaerolineae bacterium]|nr:MAG: GAF domain-containing protein [Anaerolineae bacterium]
MTTPVHSSPAPSNRFGGIYALALRLGQWLSLASIAYTIIVYFQTRALPVLGVTAGVFLTFLLVRAAGRRFPQDPDGSALLAGLGIISSYLSGELFYAGLTLFNLLGGVLMLGAVWMLVRPQRGARWLGLMGVFTLLILLASRIPLLERMDTTVFVGQNFAGPFFTAVTVVFILVQLVRSIRVRGLRNRLLSTLLLVSFVPVLVVAILTGLFGFQTGRQQVTNQLEAVAALKESQIDAWLDDQRVSFESIARPGFGASSIQDYLEGEPSRPTTLTAQIRILDEFKRLAAANDAFAEIFFIDIDGSVRVATNGERLGSVVAGQPYFRAGLQGYNVQAPVYSTTLDVPVSYLSRPIFNTSNPRPGQQPLGVLVARLNLDVLDTILTERAGLGETGETYLVSGAFDLLTPSTDPEDYPVGFTIVRTTGSLSGAETRGEGSALYVDYRGVPVLGVYRWVSNLHTLLMVEQNQEEVFAALRLNVLLNVGIAILTASLALSIAISLAQNISEPIVALAGDASRIASGEIERIETLAREDEIGDLSQALNTMTGRLQENVENLESIVAERTREVERRASYLHAAAEVGKAATQIYRLEDLLTPVTHLVSERFNFYHVGIFLLDETREFAVLQAANSEGGWRMLARGHRLKVGEQGIVGYVTSAGQPRIQQHVGEDAVYYANPDLPYTRSEMALPLRAGGELLGALDVQSTEENAFGQDDIEVLQVLADQVALAIANARLFEQLRQSIEAERRAFGELSREAWSDILQARQISAVRSDSRGVAVVDSNWTDEARQAMEQSQLVHPGLDRVSQRYPLAVPVRVRGNVVVGVLETYKPAEEGDWTTQELDALQALSEQLGIALENARLFEQTQRLAQRERIAADVSGKVWSSSDVETILQTAVQELGRALHASQGSIRLRLASEGAASNGHAANGGNGAIPDHSNGSTGLEVNE